LPKGALQDCDSVWQPWWQAITTGHVSSPAAASKPTCHQHNKVYKQHRDEIVYFDPKEIMVIEGGGQGVASHDSPQVTHPLYNGG
jgi:hypothetical protein